LSFTVTSSSLDDIGGAAAKVNSSCLHKEALGAGPPPAPGAGQGGKKAETAN